MKFYLVKLILLIILFSIPRISGTSSSYSDVETAGVSVAAGVWEVEENVQGATNPVVINEIMWMGSSSSSNDEWIELRNMTGNIIDLEGWRLENAGAGASHIILSGTIPASGYYLVSNYQSTHPQSALANTITADQVDANISFLNTGEEIILRNSAGVAIDQTSVGGWASGTNGPPSWKSMERNTDPATGWHQCDDLACNDTEFWDIEGANYGTPKKPNHSDELAIKKEEPTVSFSFESEKHNSLQFILQNIDQYKNYEYTITYTTQNSQEGIIGEGKIDDESSVSRNGIILGTCSPVEEVVCTYHEVKGKILLELTLLNGKEKSVLTSEL